MELGSSALWGLILSSFLGPVGWIIGFATPIINTVVGYSLIEFAGGKVITDNGRKDDFVVRIELGSTGTWAFTLGQVVVGSNKGLSSFSDHERGHSLQSLLLGPLYWIVIAAPSAIRAGLINTGIIVPPTTGTYWDFYTDFYTESWAEVWKW